MAQDPDLLRVVGEAVMALGTDLAFVVDATSLRILRANLAKPYLPEDLARCVREALDRVR